MKVAIFTTNPKTAYAGGRYHGAMMAASLAAAGADVSYITNNIPVFLDDLKYVAGDNPIKVYKTADFLSGLPSADADVVVVVPTAQQWPAFYEGAKAFARAAGAKLALINFESPNWFNSMVEPKRDEAMWLNWRAVCQEKCLVLSTTYESQKYAKEYYTDYPDNTHFAVWQMPVNGAALAVAAEQERTNDVLVITRAGDAHKGANDALEIISPRFSEYRFLFVLGSNAADEEFKLEVIRRAHAAGVNVGFLQMISDLEKFTILKSVRALLFPSYFEGFGIPPIEALAAGAPAVAYDLPVLRETCGRAISLARRGDKEDLADKLAAVLAGNAVFRPQDLKAQVSTLTNNAEAGARLIKVFQSAFSQNGGLKLPSLIKKNHKAKLHLAHAERIGENLISIRGWVDGVDKIKAVVLKCDDESVCPALIGLARPDVLDKRPDLGSENVGLVGGWRNSSLKGGEVFSLTCDIHLHDGSVQVQKVDLRVLDAVAPDELESQPQIHIRRAETNTIGLLKLEGTISNHEQLGALQISEGDKNLKVDIDEASGAFTAQSYWPNNVEGDRLLEARFYNKAHRLCRSIQMEVTPERADATAPLLFGGEVAALQAESQKIRICVSLAEIDIDGLLHLQGWVCGSPEPDTAQIFVNGRLCGEIGIEAGGDPMAPRAFKIDASVSAIRPENVVTVKAASGGEIVAAATLNASMDVGKAGVKDVEISPYEAGDPVDGKASVSKAILAGDTIYLRGWCLGAEPVTHYKLTIDDREIGSFPMNVKRPDLFTDSRYAHYKKQTGGFFLIAPANDLRGSQSYRMDFFAGRRPAASAQGVFTVEEPDEYEDAYADAFASRGSEMLRRIADYDWYSPEANLTELQESDRNVAVISHVMPWPATQGNRRVIMQLLRELKWRGYNVFLVLQQPAEAVRAVAPAFMGVADAVFAADTSVTRKPSRKRLLDADRYYQGTADALGALQSVFGLKAAIAQYIHMATALDALPSSVLKVIQTHDVLTRVRNEWEAIGLDLPLDRTVRELDEQRLLHKADVLVAITDVEAGMIRRLCLDKKVITVGFAAEDVETAPPSDEKESFDVLFVASDNPFNVVGLKRFIQKIWPLVLEKTPIARLRVVGAVGPTLLKSGELTDDELNNVYIFGRLGDLSGEYRRAKAVINCVWNGTGLKIKSVEAIAMGRALVSTPCAAEGIPHHEEEPFIIADSDASFADGVCLLLNDDSARAKYQESALRYAKKHLTLDIVYAPLMSAIKNASGRPSGGRISVKKSWRSTADALCASLPRSSLTAPFSVVFGGHVELGLAMYLWFRRHGMPVRAAYADFIDWRVEDGFVDLRPIESMGEDGVERTVLASVDANEVMRLERSCHAHGAETLSVIPRSSLRSRKRFIELRNVHQGERCFVIGNGPSVRLGDLERLESEITFAANRFHMCYPDTSFRPTYTGCSDILMAEQNGQVIAECCGTPLFMDARASHRIWNRSDYDIIEFDILPRPKVKNGIGCAFTDDPSLGLGNGGSILYDLLQVAVWMGVSEIYLYGVDHSFMIPQSTASDLAVRTEGEDNHFIKGYRRKNEQWYKPATELIESGFRTVRRACEERGVKIFNATRGGRLEIFERADFDDIVPPEKESASAAAE